MTRFVVVRHGNTFAATETPRRIGARTNIPLTDEGRDQARALGRHLAELYPGAAVICGPLRRSRDTAFAIAEALGARSALPEIVPWLDEIDHGPDEDRPEPEVVARIGAAALARWDQDGAPPDGWRVDADMRVAAWRAVFAAPPDGDTILVTSNGAARFAFLAEPSLHRPPSLKLRTGAFGVIERATDGLIQRCWDVRPNKARF